jgi:hypothetical protein
MKEIKMKLLKYLKYPILVIAALAFVLYCTIVLSPYAEISRIGGYSAFAVFLFSIAKTLGTPSITEWFMLYVTVVYVICTAKILKANRTSANAAERQLQVITQQHEETKHLQIRPCLVAFQANENSSIYTTFLFPFCIAAEIRTNETIEFVIKNIGLGSAINLQYTWEFKESQNSEEIISPKNNDTVLFAAKNSSEHIRAEISMPSNNQSQYKGVLSLNYTDMLDTPYEQRYEVTYKNSPVSCIQFKTLIS